MSKQNLSSFRMPTILCAFHTNETIHQFCHSKQCMLPLCKVCIPIHQKQHKTMSSPAVLVEIDQLTAKINRQIESQKQDINKKHSSIKKFYRISSDLHQQVLKRVQQTRQKTIQEINRRFNILVSQMCSLYQQKLVEIRTIHVKLEVLENTLELVKGTFNKNKPMRTVILWQSNSLGQTGNDLLSEIDEKLKVIDYDIQNDQHQQALNNKYFLQNIHSFRSPAKKDNNQIQIKDLNKYLQMLSSIIQMNVDTQTNTDIKKSFMKLRTSGISLTEVSMIKSDTKRSKDSQILSTPEREVKGVRLRELGRQAKLSGRLTTKQ